MSETRNRIVHEAARLFARQGYNATSIGDIQTAAGLATGSGALYKHFSSKQDVLHAVVRTHIDTIADTMATVVHQPEHALDELIAAARAVWDGLTNSRELVRVMYRDLDDTPEALDELWNAVDNKVFATFTDIITRGIATQQFRQVPVEHTALVLMSAISYLPTTRALIDRTPSHFTTDTDYLTAWTTIATGALSPTTA
ncbi:MAG: hypothetical protein DI630_00050 [Gordonia sp. (in: high G+C Gram-positive bacteria)]|nr:MAG: hypothetical protein DI630_00050 [Gordonia sp. (in: high G+C Gram-positive bacteria)]